MSERTTAEFVWHGVLDPGQLHADVVAARHRLADAAKAGQWGEVFRLLDEPGTPVDVNGWRPGGTAWYTPLHQAAWHGAPTAVAAELVSRGALRSLPTARGRTAFDVRTSRDAQERSLKGKAAQSHLALRSFLSAPPSPLSGERLAALDANLAAVIDGRIGGVLYDGRDPHRILRYPPVRILHEVPGQKLWFPVPGMYGGFSIELRQGYLEVSSWCRVVGGSGQTHVITPHGVTLVEEGFG